MMVPVMALLTGFVGVSLCMANISGIVTDTGTAPIAGALVQLEKGGQTATTDADGRFTLVISAAILPGNSKLLPNGLRARISGHVMTVTLAQRSVVEVATYDLGGKAISTVRRTLGAGICSIELPYRGAGVYLYRVKSGNSDYVLTGNTVCSISSGSALSSNGLSSNHLAKQAKFTVAMNDIIAVTKTGYLNYRCVQYNADTAGVAIKMIAGAGTVSDTDGNVYQTVRIGNQVWMAENLRTTKYNDGSAIPNVTDGTQWAGVTTGAYCYYHNNAANKAKYGALYNWFAVNTGKLAPTGWHVPADAEWTTLENYLIANGYNGDGTTIGNKIAKSMAAQTDWISDTTAGTIGNDLCKNNASGFSALPGGRCYNYGYFYYQGYSGAWWSATENDASDAYFRNLNGNIEDFGREYYYKGCGFSVRLLRD